MTNALVMPLGEQNLVTALTKAAAATGARYVHSYNDGAGWYTGDVRPRGVPSFFRVSAQQVWIRNAEQAEILVAKFVDGVFVLEKSAAKFFGG